MHISSKKPFIVFLALLVLASLAPLACSGAPDDGEQLGEARAAVVTSVIYANGVFTGWYNNSPYATTVADATVFESPDTKSYKTTYTAYQYSQINISSGSVGTAPDHLQFDIINKGTAATNLTLLSSKAGGSWNTAQPSLATYCAVPLNVWTTCSIPLSAYAATGGSSAITAFGWLDTGATQGPFYFDHIQLTAVGGGTGGTSAASSTAASTASSTASSTVASTVTSTASSTASSTAASTAASSSGASTGGGSDAGAPTCGKLAPLAAYASEGTASLLIDGGYRGANAWSFNPAHCTTSTPCYAAVKVASGPTVVKAQWTYQDGSGEFVGQGLQNYTVETSADSTSGNDGTWTTAATVAQATGNVWYTHVDQVNFTGQSWLRLRITSSTAQALDELELWDASPGCPDESFFIDGDSITHRWVNTHGTASGYTEQPSFQADVPGFPLVVGAGVTGIGSPYAAAHIGEYLAAFPVHYWVLAVGTNDLCNTTPDDFQTNLQTWVTAVKAAGKEAILVHFPWPNNDPTFCFQNDKPLLARIDAVVKANNLRPAIQFYEATYERPEAFDSGDVHTNNFATGLTNGGNGILKKTAAGYVAAQGL